MKYSHSLKSKTYLLSTFKIYNNLCTLLQLTFTITIVYVRYQDSCATNMQA